MRVASVDAQMQPPRKHSEMSLSCRLADEDWILVVPRIRTVCVSEIEADQVRSSVRKYKVSGNVVFFLVRFG